MQAALAEARAESGVTTGGERVHAELWPDAYYVRPAIVEMTEQTPLVRRETFAPILYAMRYCELDETIARHNAVAQGLASSIFTNDLREAELFTSSEGSDCGIVNVNIGPSGAEIGGAFAGKRRPAAGARPAAMPGKPICAAPPTPSTIRASCRWRKASDLSRRMGPSEFSLGRPLGLEPFKSLPSS